MTLLIPREVDRLLRYPRGRALHLARAGKLPHVTLPDGEIRFERDELEKSIRADSKREETTSVTAPQTAQ